MKKRTGIILAHDEKELVPRAIASLQPCVNEVLVVTDNHNFGGGSRYHPLHDDFAQHRNWAMAQATHDEIVFLDADEVLSDDAQTFITHLPEVVSAYSLRRIDRMWGRELHYGEARQQVTRIVNRTRGRFIRPVHEVWDGPMSPRSEILYHDAHDSVTEFIRSVNKYSSIRAQELFTQNVAVHWYDFTMRPVAKFIHSYLLCQGFRDGMPGFVYSYMMSFHSFLTRAKLHQLKKNA